jgi:hypothetical protein
MVPDSSLMSETRSPLKLSRTVLRSRSSLLESGDKENGHHRSFVFTCTDGARPGHAGRDVEGQVATSPTLVETIVMDR